MKNKYLPFVVLCVSITALAVPPRPGRRTRRLGSSTQHNQPTDNNRDSATLQPESIYCLELDCWSLKDCLMHHPRTRFLNYMLSKKNEIKKKATQDAMVLSKLSQAMVLPGLPQAICYLIATYADHAPSYTIAGYTCKAPGNAIEPNGEIYEHYNTRDMHIGRFIGTPTLYIQLDPVEADFFKKALVPPTCTSLVRYQDRGEDLEVSVLNSAKKCTASLLSPDCIDVMTLRADKIELFKRVGLLTTT